MWEWNMVLLVFKKGRGNRGRNSICKCQGLRVKDNSSDKHWRVLETGLRRLTDSRTLARSQWSWFARQEPAGCINSSAKMFFPCSVGAMWDRALESLCPCPQCMDWKSLSVPLGSGKTVEVLTTVALVQSSSLSFLRSFFSQQDPCLCSSSRARVGQNV